MSYCIRLYCDGACSGNPGPGGWSYLLQFDSYCNNEEAHGYENLTTNNRMELLAVINGLLRLKYRCDVDIYSDSKYVVTGVNQWLSLWKSNNWHKANGSSVSNLHLWKLLDLQLRMHNVNVHWILGHSEHLENDRVDYLARKAILCSID